MAIAYTRTYSTTCTGDLINYINADPLVGVTLEQIIDDGSGQLQFWFELALLTSQQAQLDSDLATFTCPMIVDASASSAVINDTTSGVDVLWSSTQVINSLAAQDELKELKDVLIPTPNTNDILTYNGTKWVNAPGYANVTTITANYAVLISDVIILCNGTLTATLPTAVGNKGKTFHFKNIGTLPVTINTSLGQLLDGASGIKITHRYNSYMIVSDGNNWFVV